MLELAILAVTAASAAKIALILLGCFVGAYVLFMAFICLGCEVWGLVFFGYLQFFASLIFKLAIAFGVIFLIIMGVGALL